MPSIFESQNANLVDALVKDYFCTVTSLGSHKFTGARFETLAAPGVPPRLATSSPSAISQPCPACRSTYLGRP